MRDLLHAERHGAQARAAKLVHAPGRSLLGNACLHGRLARRILPFSRLKHLAEDYLVDFRRIDARALERALDGGSPKLVRWDGSECTIERADRCAGRAGDDDG